MGLDDAEPWTPEPLAPGALGAERPPAPSPMAAASRSPEPPPADVCAAIEAALAASQTPLEGGVSAAQLLDRARGLARLVNLAQAELARTVAHAESVDAAYADGLTGMRPWLRGHAHLSGPEAAGTLAAGRLAVRMPAVGAGAATGGITGGQVALIGRILADDVWATGEAAGVDLPALDLLVAETALQAPRTLADVCRRIADAIDPDGPPPTDPTEGRGLRISRRADGTRAIRGQLDAAGGEQVEAALEAIAAAGRCEGDLRSRDQRAADALVQLAALHLAAGDLPMLRTTKPQVTALIQLEDLADPDTRPAATRLGSGATASNTVARQAACDGDVARVLLGPDGLPLDVGRAHRLVPAHIRRAAEVRDGGCVFTGCHAPAWWCDAHHLIHWIDGGATSLENTALLCERHHTQVHHGYRLKWDPDDRCWRTFRPDGREIITGLLTDTTVAPIDHRREPDPPLFPRSG
ncbi:HNH endonuclease signature motif containing protein [Klenkia sp. PcliD-1-E]|uniref:HNH endonuclease signature motif containing protein n=1 Tax=Klenkia sp. PcliD-1-E TaxID=2954492 RepID=UPI002097CA11|nr:HNH endonuclease signature motif containing protein [Klenkia sp. PcliD-1-E]MCO7220090.1 HNH endonuclease [Klenkia sp. PcliD-1-E]